MTEEFQIMHAILQDHYCSSNSWSWGSKVMDL